MLETLFGIGLQIEKLDAILYNNGAGKGDWENRAMRMSHSIVSVNPQARMTALGVYRDLIARFMAGLTTGLSLNITMDQIIQDSMPWVPSRLAPTFLFLSSFSLPGGHTHALFLDQDGFSRVSDPSTFLHMFLDNRSEPW
jgi:hypothetical protein